MGQKAVIFDLDGTLLDSLADIADALNRVLAHHGYAPLSIEQCRRRVGWGMRELVRRSLEEGADDALIDRMTQAVEAEYQRRPVVKTAPYPGVPALIRDMRDATIKMAVLSNKPDPLVQVIVEQTLGRNWFGRVLGNRPGVAHKPNPQSTREILLSLEVQPEECLFVGDSEVDMETARSAGCVPVGVSWGFRDEKTLRQAGALQICHSVESLREFVGLQERRREKT
ncbi:phosphoglycolate phosphatase [Alkalispirochaeta americana]|uniref:phosphoglycolate phosphatase n=1 Tax=Alkalispirochaeta americana TaxID=159291 RepID=A0A1N6T1J6_9SPIO|nr:HAD family hydrolase [Alkalispirochaeta americana]SIQ47203.1 phosphoglycolate phosphatase [Alkalispirochaeta americana]